VAVGLAREGADIIAINIAAPVETSIAPSATLEDLEETVRLVENLNRRIYWAQADVRDYDKPKFALDQGVAELGRLGIAVANAGLWSYGLAQELTEEAWQTVIDVDLTGVWHTAKAAIPILKEQGTAGSIILTSNAMGLKASPSLAHYVAAKHGVVGLMCTLALELAADNIRVNTVNPTTMNTDLIQNAPTYELFAPTSQPRTAHERSSSPGSRPSMPWTSPGSNRRTSRTRSSGSHPTKPAT
jgi:NAD(P)-dependent dehydrogenase (short-subunit alcohol dehydrogenase family)